ncbi:hypothetical protein ENSA5_04140 [Enhygromyxa salina]|uniref:Uncharacterized protein n=1 Tax=Enhygromyxa salina TaxID=215803 RepID=A0A2S9YJL8_9BACT|nr:hypothetical protein [Enhygromyxa salina]PRQ05295.1 hypothetical protein ENSA5_04140 [Enhygromyxa salina]
MPESPATTEPSAPTKLWEKLLSGIKSAVELRVVTYVGDANVKGDIGKPQVNLDGAKGDAIVTSINLVEGDINSVVPDRFWTPDKDVVRKYHQDQVDKSNAIVERNLRLIGELGAGLAKAIGDLKALEDPKS